MKNLVIATTVLALCAARPATGEILLCRDGTEPCPVVYDKAGAKKAAEGLVRYLKKISGAPFRVQASAGEVRSPGIVVGAPDPAWQNTWAGDSFAMRVHEGTLYLFGNTDRATGYAVYAFLEEQLGCRWWSFNEEDVPSKKTIRVATLDVVHHAPMRQTDIFNGEAQARENNFDLKSRCKSTEQFTGNHTLYPLLKDYAEKHPEIYPLLPVKDPKTKEVLRHERKHNNLHFCYSADGIVGALTAALAAEVEKRKGNVRDFIYFAGMGDWKGGTCRCEACKAIYSEETWTRPDGKAIPGVSGTLLRMINAVAEGLEKQYPGVRVGTFAYMSLDAPPGKTRPRDNVVVWMPHLRYGVSHPLTSSVIPGNQGFLWKLEEWCRIAPGNMYIWEYGANYGQNFLFPFPVIRAIGENIKTYAELGCAGVMIQGNYVSKGSDLVVLKNYVWRKLMWDPTLDVDTLIREFCDGYYGAAGTAMQGYVFALEDAVARSETGFDEFCRLDRMREIYLTDALVPVLQQHLDRALTAAAGKDPIESRVREAAVSLAASQLWVGKGRRHYRRGDGHLERVDLGRNTWPEVIELLKYCRDASPREFGTGHSYRQGLLYSHGGPLLTLGVGDLNVEVAPVQLGRIYQIHYRGRPLLLSQHDEGGKQGAYTVLRGAREQLKCGGIYTRFESPSSKELVMEADCGIEHWDWTTKMVAHKRILVDGNTVRIRGYSERKAKKPGFSHEVVVAITDFLLDEDETCEVATVRDDARWERIALEPGGSKDQSVKVEGPGRFDRLRLTFPQRRMVIEDNYRAPAVISATFTWDTAHRTLTAELKLASAATTPRKRQTFSLDDFSLEEEEEGPGSEFEPWIDRRITVRDIK